MVRTPKRKAAIPPQSKRTKRAKPLSTRNWDALIESIRATDNQNELYDKADEFCRTTPENGVWVLVLRELVDSVSDFDFEKIMSKAVCRVAFGDKIDDAMDLLKTFPELGTRVLELVMSRVPWTIQCAVDEPAGEFKDLVIEHYRKMFDFFFDVAVLVADVGIAGFKMGDPEDRIVGLWQIIDEGHIADDQIIAKAVLESPVVLQWIVDNRPELTEKELSIDTTPYGPVNFSPVNAFSLAGLNQMTPAIDILWGIEGASDEALAASATRFLDHVCNAEDARRVIQQSTLPKKRFAHILRMGIQSFFDNQINRHIWKELAKLGALRIEDWTDEQVKKLPVAIPDGTFPGGPFLLDLVEAGFLDGAGLNRIESLCPGFAEVAIVRSLI